jgi:serpin B
MKNRPRLLSVVMWSLLTALFTPAAEGAPSGEATPAAHAINALGIDLLAQGTDAGANALLSPYCIQSALAMTFAGAAGDTRAEMARVLHYAGDERALHQSFAALQAALEEVRQRTTALAEKAKQRGGPSEPVTLTVANRLFGQQGFEFRPDFLALTRQTYGVALLPLDFLHHPDAARHDINTWVEEQTRQRIRDLIPPDGVDQTTRLVLVNAIYLKAPWLREFPAGGTAPAPFYVRGTTATDVPTMMRQARFGYAHRDGFTVVTIPYSGEDLQFLILLPDGQNGLAALEKKLTPNMLAAAARPEPTDVRLYLPKFKLEPPLFRLTKVLQGLGLHSAFDQPPGSANFDRMAPRKAGDYLFISEVFHKSFLALDEQGTEAAAATAVAMALRGAAPGNPAPPIEVRVDRPFLFAIQHRPSGACLFLGRMTDPR